MPAALPPKIADFRTFLEIFSFVLAGKPTDTNFVYYNTVKVFFQWFFKYFELLLYKSINN